LVHLILEISAFKLDQCYLFIKQKNPRSIRFRGFTF